MFGYMKVHCPICQSEFDGMKPYGREAACCCKECYQEWNWRRSLAICNQSYHPDPTRLATGNHYD